MIGTITILAAASVAATLVTGARVVGLRRIVEHSTKVDVIFTAVIGFCLAGTITGLAAAILAGLFMALVLTVLKVMYRGCDGALNASDSLMTMWQQSTDNNTNLWAVKRG